MKRLVRFARWSFLLAVAVALSNHPSYGASSYKRQVAQYRVPQLKLVNQKGEEVEINGLLEGPRPVILQFVYCTCTTICPVLSAVFSNFQRKFACEKTGPHDLALDERECELAKRYRLVSVTIDPEHDRPEVLAAYLARYRAGPHWEFLTGSRRSVDAVMRAFDAYVPDKMSHYPLTFIHAGGKAPWIRLFGFMSTADLVREYKAAIKGVKAK